VAFIVRIGLLTCLFSDDFYERATNKKMRVAETHTYKNDFNV